MREPAAAPAPRAPAAPEPVRVAVRRRVLRRAAWLAVDLVAVGACLILFLRA